MSDSLHPALIVAPSTVKNTLLCVDTWQIQEQPQVPKKKKKTKKSKTEDSDSGVEVYFREEDDKEEEEKHQPESGKVSECTAAPHHTNIHSSGTAVS